MDHGKIHGPVRKKLKQRRTNENMSMREKAKVGLADEAIAIVSIGQKEEVERN